MKQDIIKEIRKMKNVSNVIIMTFNVDFIFIQTVLLRTLKRCGNPSLTIFADAGCVKESYKNQKDIIEGLGTSYRIIPIEMDSPYFRFHPKAILLSGEEEATLYVGSGNLSFGGWRQNAEIWNRFSSKDDGTAQIASFQQYLHNLKNRVQDISSIDSIISEPYDNKTKNWAGEMDEPSGLAGRVDGEDALIEQLKHSVESNCKHLIIHSPYFDKEGKSIQQLYKEFAPEEITIWAQAKHSQLSQKIIDSLPDNCVCITVKFNNEERVPFMHAKFYAFQYDDKVVLCSGSANCSQAALTLSDNNGNAELMVIREMSEQDFNSYVKSELRFEGTFKPEYVHQDSDSEEALPQVQKVSISSARYEFGNLAIAVKKKSEITILSCFVGDTEVQINSASSDISIEHTPSRTDSVYLTYQGDDSIETCEPHWIDFETELQCNAKTKALANYIDVKDDLSWNHNSWGELIKIFHSHLKYTPESTGVKFDSNKYEEHQRGYSI